MASNDPNLKFCRAVNQSYDDIRTVGPLSFRAVYFRRHKNMVSFACIIKTKNTGTRRELILQESRPMRGILCLQSLAQGNTCAHACPHCIVATAWHHEKSTSVVKWCAALHVHQTSWVYMTAKQCVHTWVFQAEQIS